MHAAAKRLLFHENLFNSLSTKIYSLKLHQLYAYNYE